MYTYYGDDFTVECPVRSGRWMSLWEVADEIGHQLGRIFPRDAEGRRPVYGHAAKFRTDPRWKDLILFYKYFHGDNGARIGASHQTGWTRLISWLMMSLTALGPRLSWPMGSMQSI